jgi:hypothetical protein
MGNGFGLDHSGNLDDGSLYRGPGPTRQFRGDSAPGYLDAETVQNLAAQDRDRVTASTVQTRPDTAIAP